MCYKRITWAIIVAAIIIIQLIPTRRPEVITTNKNDMVTNNVVPDTVVLLLKNACYDCHSNETKYPWYSYVAPVSWLISRDIRLGREELNFSKWESLSKMDKAKMLEEIVDEIESGAMPMSIYVLMHPEAKLSMSDRDMIMNWADDFGEKLFE